MQHAIATSAPTHAADPVAALRALPVRALGATSATPARAVPATLAIATLTPAEAARGCFVVGPYVYATGGRFGACSRRVR